MPNNLIFSRNTNGNITFTGNAIGLSKQENSQDSGIVNSIGALMASDLNYLQVPTYPPATTLDYLLDSSRATLNIPNGSSILFAVLSWGGCCKVPGENRISSIVNGVILRSPNPSAPSKFILPQETYFTDETKDVVFFSCYAIITDKMQDAISGSYRVSEIPVTSEATDNSNNCGGWTLAVVYTNPSLPARSISIYAGLEAVNSLNPFTLTTSFSKTPESSPQNGRALLSAMHASATLGDNKVLFGPNEYTLAILYGPRNLANHFFGSQINDDTGNIDTSGTFGNRNQDILSGTNIVGGRQGWDITNVDASLGLISSQTSGIFKFVTTNNNYLLNMLGLQVDIDVPQLSITKTVSPIFASIGDIVEYTISIQNNTSTTFNNLVLTDKLSNEISYVPNSLTINEIPSSDSPITGVNLGNIVSSETILVKFKANVNLESSNNFTYLNSATVNYEVGTAPNVVYASSKSNINKLYSSSIIIRPNINITANPDIVSLKDIVEYTININNTTTSPIQNVIFINSLPLEFSYVDNSLTINGISISYNPDVGINLGSINSWETIIIKFKANVNSKPNSGSEYTDSATLNYKFNTADGLLPYNITVTNNIVYLIGGDTPKITDITKTVSPIFASIGDVVQYTISIQNNTSTTFNNLVLTDKLSKEISYVPNSLTVNGNDSNYSPITGVILGNLVPFQTLLIKFKGKVNLKSDNNFDYINFATVNYEVGTPPNVISAISTSNINKLYASSIIIKPYINITGNPIMVSINDIVEYTITINNTTPNIIYHAVLNNKLPTEFSYIPNSLTINDVLINANLDNGIILDSINPWQTIIVKFKTQVNSQPLDVISQYTDSATLSYEFNTSDGFLPYIVTASTTINSSNISVSPIVVKTAISSNPNPNVAAVGDTINYTITINNPSAKTIKNIIFKDLLPKGLSIKPNSLTVNEKPISGDIEAGINLGDMPTKDTIIIKFVAEVMRFTYINSAIVNYEFLSPNNTLLNSSTIATNSIYYDNSSNPVDLKPIVFNYKKIIYKNTSVTGKITSITLNNNLKYTLFKSPKNGYAKVDMYGIWKYTPKVNFIGLDNFDILTQDEDNNYSISKITILIKTFPNSFDELDCCKNKIQ